MAKGIFEVYTLHEARIPVMMKGLFKDARIPKYDLRSSPQFGSIGLPVLFGFRGLRLQCPPAR